MLPTFSVAKFSIYENAGYRPTIRNVGQWSSKNCRGAIQSLIIQLKGKMSNELEKFLIEHKIEVTPPALKKLDEVYGVTKLEHLDFIKKEDLMDVGIKVVQCRALLYYYDQYKKRTSAIPIHTSATPIHTSATPVHTPISLSPLQLSYDVIKQATKSKTQFQIKYVLCIDMFIVNQEEQYISVNPEQDTMDFLIKEICNIHQLSQELTLELYNKNGIPLNVNEYTSNLTLRKWEVQLNDSYYVLPRRKSQPFWDPPATILDEANDKGQSKLKVLSEVFGHFTIDWKECFKKFHVFGIETDASINQDVKIASDVDEVIVRFKEIHSVTGFGKPSYIPIQEQTEKGLAKFYSVLKYLSYSGPRCDKIPYAVSKIADCVPLTAALYQFTKFSSFSHLSHLAILFEGFYSLSKAFLENFCNVKDNEVFEFFDYIFGYIMKYSENLYDSHTLEFNIVELKCPITSNKIIEPVTVSIDAVINQLSYERKAAVKLIKDKQVLPQCKDCIEEQDLLPNEQLQHYLIAFSFSRVADILALRISSEKMRPLMFPCSWKELRENVIKVRKEDFLGQNGCFTCNKAVYLGNTKTAKLQYYFYNPMTCKQDTYAEADLEEIKGKSVTHNIAEFLHPKAKALLKDFESSQKSNEPSSKEGITKEPKEAIMVVLDTSSSMNGEIFKEYAPNDKYRRITAAVDFFTAFANRTQAYEFPHVLGAIYFNDTPKEVLSLSELQANFETTINKANNEVRGQTALYDALKAAANTLSEFTSQFPSCHRRILCLTDGKDNRSKATPFDVSAFLAKKNVVVDSILITSGGNANLKAISHATGGLCFLPKNRREGTRIFEMETLLSADFDQIQQRDYDSTDPYSFKSTFFEGIDETVTCSAKRMITLATIMSDEHLSHTSSSKQPNVQSLMRELKTYVKNPHQDIEEYPYKPPEMRFITPIYHCNINSNGRICHPILGRNYLPTLSIKEIFDHIYGLLMAPEPDDPLDSVLAEEFHTEKDEYMRKARELTQDKATKVTWENYKKALGEEAGDVSDDFKCPLTGKLFINPVSTPSGHTYERDALLEYMARNDNMDPKSKQRIANDELRPNSIIKKLVDNFRKTNLV
uniref:U-box domain-containing protein n=1 Tax=Amphimedon queenslandica TaxID=400682 RepID=A0A1X7UR59_AMPQE